VITAATIEQEAASLIRDCRGSRERARVVALSIAEELFSNPPLQAQWRQVVAAIPTVEVAYPDDWPHVKEPADFSACLSNPKWGA